MQRKRAVPALLLAPFILVTAVVLRAMLNILIQSLGYMPVFDLHEITLKYYIEVLKRPEVIQSVWVSLKVSVASSLFAAAAGTVICAALVRMRRTEGSLIYAIRLPILMPHTVVALFTVVFFAQTGLVSRIAYASGLIGDYTEFPAVLFGSGYAGVMFAYIWKEAPFIAYFSLALMSGVSSTLGEAAENLGATPLRSFMHITLPMSLPAIAKAFLIVLVFSFGGYELPLLLGSTLPKAFPVYTYIEFLKPDFKLRPYAMAMNGITLIISLMMAVIYAICMRQLLRKTGGGHEK